MNPDILIEGFVARLLPFNHEVTLNAMRQFQPEHYAAGAVVAGAGALAAMAVYYAIGVWLRRLPAKVSTEEQQARIEKIRLAATGWLPWLLILSPTPVGGVLVMAAGFFVIRPWVAAAAITAAEVLWRVSPVV